jgi:hypothetical protein
MEHQQTHYQVSSYICNQFMGVLKVLRHVVCKLNLKNHLAYVIQSVKSQIEIHKDAITNYICLYWKVQAKQIDLWYFTPLSSIFR